MLEQFHICIHLNGLLNERGGCLIQRSDAIIVTVNI